MKVSMNLDSTRFDRKMMEMKRRNADAQKAGVAALGAGLAAQMIFLASPHRDTNRFTRSLEQAHNDLARIAGVAPINLSPIKPSRKGDIILEKLEISLMRALKQEQKIAGWIAANERRPDFNPAWPSHRKLVRAYDKAGDVTDRAIQSLEKFQNASAEEQASAIVIYGSRANRKNRSILARTTRNLDRVIVKQYGGRGSAVCTPNTAMATIASYEPHARIVDRKFRIGSRATASIRRLGVRTFSTSYLRRLGKESGVNPARLTGLDRPSSRGAA